MVICLGSSVSNDGGVTLNYGWDWNYWEGKEMARFNNVSALSLFFL